GLPAPRSSFFPYTTLFRSLTLKISVVVALRCQAAGGCRRVRRRRSRGRDVLDSARLAGPKVVRSGAAALGARELVHEVIDEATADRKSTRLNSSHQIISYA